MAGPLDYILNGTPIAESAPSPLPASTAQDPLSYILGTPTPTAAPTIPAQGVAPPIVDRAAPITGVVEGASQAWDNVRYRLYGAFLSAFGNEEKARQQLAIAEERYKARVAEDPNTIRRIQDIRTDDVGALFSDLASYIGYTAGNAPAQMIGTVVPAGAAILSGAPGAVIAGTAIGANLLTGALPESFAGTAQAALEAGKNTSDALLPSLAAAGAKSVLDVAPVFATLSKAQQARLVGEGLLKALGREVPKGSLYEGVTETAQTFIDQIAASAVNKNRELFSAENTMEMVEGFAAGLVGGALFSGAATLTRPSAEKPPQQAAIDPGLPPEVRTEVTNASEAVDTLRERGIVIPQGLSEEQLVDFTNNKVLTPIVREMDRLQRVDDATKVATNFDPLWNSIATIPEEEFTANKLTAHITQSDDATVNNSASPTVKTALTALVDQGFLVAKERTSKSKGKDAKEKKTTYYSINRNLPEDSINAQQRAAEALAQLQQEILNRPKAPRVEPIRPTEIPSPPAEAPPSITPSVFQFLKENKGRSFTSGQFQRALSEAEGSTVTLRDYRTRVKRLAKDGIISTKNNGATVTIKATPEWVPVDPKKLKPTTAPPLAATTGKSGILRVRNALGGVELQQLTPYNQRTFAPKIQQRAISPVEETSMALVEYFRDRLGNSSRFGFKSIAKLRAEIQEYVGRKVTLPELKAALNTVEGTGPLVRNRPGKGSPWEVRAGSWNRDPNPTGTMGPGPFTEVDRLALDRGPPQQRTPISTPSVNAPFATATPSGVSFPFQQEDAEIMQAALAEAGNVEGKDVPIGKIVRRSGYPKNRVLEAINRNPQYGTSPEGRFFIPAPRQQLPPREDTSIGTPAAAQSVLKARDRIQESPARTRIQEGLAKSREAAIAAGAEVPQLSRRGFSVREGVDDAEMLFQRAFGNRATLSFQDKIPITEVPGWRQVLDASGWNDTVPENVNGYTIGSSVKLALNFGNPYYTAVHEGVHVAEHLGLIDGTDKKIISGARARLNKYIKKYLPEVPNPDALSDVEYRAYALEALTVHGDRGLGTLSRPFYKMRNFFISMGNFFRGLGWRNPESILRSIFSGENIVDAAPAAPITPLFDSSEKGRLFYNKLDRVFNDNRSKRLLLPQWRAEFLKAGVKEVELKDRRIMETAMALADDKGFITRDAMKGVVDATRIQVAVIKNKRNWGNMAPKDDNELPTDGQPRWGLQEYSGEKLELPGPTENYMEYLVTLPNNADGNYTSSHWQGVPNVVVHVRANIRRDPDGNRVFFIEEVQSDWHQQGARYGYSTSENIARKRNLENKIIELDFAISKTKKDLSDAGNVFELKFYDDFKIQKGPFVQVPFFVYTAVAKDIDSYGKQTVMKMYDIPDSVSSALDIMYEKYLTLEKLKSEKYAAFQQLSALDPIGDISNAPFRESQRWTELALKVALRQAVDEGAQYISWTTAADQRKRYSNEADVPDSTKYVKTYDKDIPNILKKLTGQPFSEVKLQLGNVRATDIVEDYLDNLFSIRHEIFSTIEEFSTNIDNVPSAQESIGNVGYFIEQLISLIRNIDSSDFALIKSAQELNNMAGDIFSEFDRSENFVQAQKRLEELQAKFNNFVPVIKLKLRESTTSQQLTPKSAVKITPEVAAQVLDGQPLFSLVTPLRGAIQRNMEREVPFIGRFINSRSRMAERVPAFRKINGIINAFDNKKAQIQHQTLPLLNGLTKLTMQENSQMVNAMAAAEAAGRKVSGLPPKLQQEANNIYRAMDRMMMRFIEGRVADRIASKGGQVDKYVKEITSALGGYPNYDDAAFDTLQINMNALRKDEPELAKFVAENAKLLGKGYIPHVREGDHYIAVVEKGTNKTIYYDRYDFSMWKSDQRADWLKQLQGKYSTTKYDFVGFQEPKKVYDNEHEAVVEGVDSLFDQMISMTALKSNPAVVAYVEKLKDRFANSNANIFQRSRQNVPGWLRSDRASTYFSDILPGHIMGGSYTIARSSTQGQFDKEYRLLNSTDLKRYSKELWQYINSSAESASGWRTAAYFMFMGFAVDSAVLNLTQNLHSTLPYLNMYTDPARATALLAKAHADILRATSIKEAFDPTNSELRISRLISNLSSVDEKQALRAVAAKDKLSPVYNTELRGSIRELFGSRQAGSTINKVVEYSSVFFGAVEQTNRISAFLSAYRLAKSKPSILGPNETAQQFAERAIDETQFISGKSDKPYFMRMNPVMEVATQFIYFPLRLAEKWWGSFKSTVDYKNLTPVERNRAGKYFIMQTLMIMALGGVMALPFANFIKDFMEWAIGIGTGIEQDFFRDLRLFLDKNADPTIGRALYNGIFDPLLGVDISRRMYIEPFQFSLLQNANPVGNVPAVGATFGKLEEAWNRYREGADSAKVFHALLPRAMDNALTAGRMLDADSPITTRQGTPILAADQITDEDAFKRALGFNSSRISDARFALYSSNFLDSRNATAQEVTKNRLARLLYGAIIADREGAPNEGNRLRALAMEQIEAIREYNERVLPSARIKIDSDSLKKQVAEYLIGGTDASLLKRTEPANRLEMLQQLRP